MVEGTDETLQERTETAPRDIDDVATLQQELERARQDAVDNRDKYLRVRADMENFRKRMERTYSDQATSSRKSLLLKLLNVEDNLERALHYAGAGENNGESLQEGVRLTKYQLDQVLESEGVKPIEAEGRPFDPNLEEAIHRVHDPELPDQIVTQVARTGYTLGEVVLRPAQVVVNVHGEG